MISEFGAQHPKAQVWVCRGADRALFWRRQFLNPFAFLNAPERVRVP